LKRKLLTVVLSSVLLVVGSVEASAHTVLVSSNPAKNAKLNALPEKVVLKFAEPLLTIKGKEVNRISVTDSQNHELVSGTSTVTGLQVSAPLNLTGNPKGTFHVNFRVAAQDGHVLNGAFDFSVNKK